MALTKKPGVDLSKFKREGDKKPAPAPKPALITGPSAAELDDILDGIRTGGDETAMLLGSDGLMLKIRGVIPTGCPGLDDAIGRGGAPLGRLSILHGAEGSGKTTIALQLVANVQRMGGVAIYMDKEYKLDPEYATNLGVDNKRLIISQPSHMEQMFQVTEQAIAKAAAWRLKAKRRVPILIVLDSMNAAITKAQLEGDWDDQHMAPQARCYSANLPKLIPKVSKEDVALVWISQVRQKMNVAYGDDQEIAGGKAPRFYASLIINFKKVGTVKSGEEKIGNRVLAECKKNQIAPPHRKSEFTIVYGKGTDAEMGLVELAIDKKVLSKKGGWITHDDEKLGNGVAQAAEALRSNPEWAAKIAKEAGVQWDAPESED
jgi:recombination protein RecA